MTMNDSQKISEIAPSPTIFRAIRAIISRLSFFLANLARSNNIIILLCYITLIITIYSQLNTTIYILSQITITVFTVPLLVIGHSIFQ